MTSWSPISSLPLTKTQTPPTRQSPIVPQLQQQQQMKPNQANLSYYERDRDRHSEVIKSSETERWISYMHYNKQQQQQHHHHHNRANEMVHYQSTIVNGPSNTKRSITSPLMDASSSQVTKSTTTTTHCMNSQPQRSAKAEPSFSLYGYQPNQLSFITPAQLKENNRLNNNIANNVMKVPPAAHTIEKRESPKIMDRALTPSGRNSGTTNCAPIGRPPSLSPKQKQIKVERLSPLYNRSSTQFNSSHYSGTNAPPAHQNSNSRSNTPHMSSPSPHMSVVYTTLQDQPQNLVKIENKSKATLHSQSQSQSQSYNKQLNQIEMQSQSSSQSPYSQSRSLIQQGLVPNPLYSTASTTPSTTTTTSSITSVIAKPQPKVSQLFTKPGPGINSGIPIRNTNVRSQCKYKL
jgi:hypothetical protein